VVVGDIAALSTLRRLSYLDLTGAKVKGWPLVIAGLTFEDENDHHGTRAFAIGVNHAVDCVINADGHCR
jgi:hypothetical protein